MQHPVRTPSEIERLALLDVLTHVILMVRANSINMTGEQVSHLMDAVHNIPLFLQTNETLLWETILWDLRHCDSRGMKMPYCETLMEWYNRAYRRYADQAECASSTPTC